jgi:hypothetical protein
MKRTQHKRSPSPVARKERIEDEGTVETTRVWINGLGMRVLSARLAVRS